LDLSFVLDCVRWGVEPEGWVGGDTRCPLCVGNYSKPRVLKEPGAKSKGDGF
jgi:hypothetical protein